MKKAVLPNKFLKRYRNFQKKMLKMLKLEINDAKNMLNKKMIFHDVIVKLWKRQDCQIKFLKRCRNFQKKMLNMLKLEINDAKNMLNKKIIFHNVLVKFKFLNY